MQERIDAYRKALNEIRKTTKHFEGQPSTTGPGIVSRKIRRLAEAALRK